MPRYPNNNNDNNNKIGSPSQRIKGSGRYAVPSRLKDTCTWDPLQGENVGEKVPASHWRERKGRSQKKAPTAPYSRRHWLIHLRPRVRLTIPPLSAWLDNKRLVVVVPGQQACSGSAFFTPLEAERFKKIVATAERVRGKLD
jgi:hypothetical protein